MALFLAALLYLVKPCPIFCSISKKLGPILINENGNADTSSPIIPHLGKQPRIASKYQAQTEADGILRSTSGMSVSTPPYSTVCALPDVAFNSRILDPNSSLPILIA